MFGVGPFELALVLLLALIVFGPEKLPEVFRTVGKTIAEFRRASQELTDIFTAEMNTVQSEITSLQSDLTSLTQEVTSVQETVKDVSSTATEAVQSVTKAASGPTSGVVATPLTIHGPGIPATSPTAAATARAIAPAAAVAVNGVSSYPVRKPVPVPAEVVQRPPDVVRSITSAPTMTKPPNARLGRRPLWGKATPPAPRPEISVVAEATRTIADVRSTPVELATSAPKARRPSGPRKRSAAPEAVAEAETGVEVS